MSKFDLIYTQEFTNTNTIVLTHNLNRRVFDIRIIDYGTTLGAESRREIIMGVDLDPLDPLNKLTVYLDGNYTGKIQLIAEDTVQSPYYTVEDKLQSQIGIARFPIQLIMNGTVGNNDYIAYSNLLSNSAIRFPSNSKITELTWNNNNTGVDFRLEFSRYQANGTPYAGNPFYSYTVSNGGYGGIVTGLNHNLLGGDYILIQYKDLGSNVSDFALVVWCYKTA